MRYQEVLTFAIELRQESGQRLRDQIAEQIAAAVDSRAVLRGTRVPSTRTLAELLGVSRGVVTEAYDLLFSRGYLVKRPGSGTYIGPGPGDPGQPNVLATGTQDYSVDFTPGQLCGEAFPIRAWRAAWRHASYQVPAPAMPPALGLPALRQAIADHVAHRRGPIAPTHEVVVTPGLAAGLRLVLAALGEAAAVQVPMPPELLRAAGDHRPFTGCMAELDRDIRVAVLSPDGDRPLGTIMAAEHRWAALAWSRAGGTIVEVARDAVFQPRTAGLLPRLLQPDTDNVLIGGFDELLTPSLKLGYAVAPRELARRVGELIAGRGEQPLDLTQRAVARLLAEGTVARQTHRLSRLYAAKYEVVAKLLDGRQEPAEVGVCLVRSVDESVPERLRQRGIRLRTLDIYGIDDRALVLGFGHLPDKVLRRGLGHLLSSLH